MFENHFKKFRNISDIFEKYFGKFQKIYSKKISDNILETFENCFGILWKNLGKFLEIFQKVSRKRLPLSILVAPSS